MGRIIRPALERLGLRWVNFQVIRRTQASLSHEAGMDPKVSADRRGHTIGVEGMKIRPLQFIEDGAGDGDRTRDQQLGRL